MLVEFERRWKTFQAGQVTVLGDGIADALLRRGIVKKQKPKRRRKKKDVQPDHNIDQPVSK